jgi:hypothetical protein
MGFLARRVFPILVLFVSPTVLCQLPSSRCDALAAPLEDCAFLTMSASSSLYLREDLSPDDAIHASYAQSNLADTDDQSNGFINFSRPQREEHFHWGRALFESFTFLAIEQAYVVKDDYRWVVVENGIPLNHYWHDYKQSLSTWAHSGWDDGDPVLYSYLGHPIQGALTEYIQIQNDPQGRELELSNTKAYWWSRFKALIWNAAYSTQWNIGPLSELTVEKYGAAARPPWNQDGSWPCTKKPCVTGVGQVDLVMTPIGGFAWQLGEDFLDKEIARRVEGTTQNHFLIDVTRCALNPIRGGANILHGKRPWYRASRDARQLYLSRHSNNGVTNDSPSE